MADFRFCMWISPHITLTGLKALTDQLTNNSADGLVQIQPYVADWAQSTSQLTNNSAGGLAQI